jgi:hypothetical protein
MTSAIRRHINGGLALAAEFMNLGGWLAMEQAVVNP